MDLEITTCGSNESGLWDQFVHHCSSSTFCHDFRWRAIIQKVYGHRPFYLAAKSCGHLRGVLPLFEVKSRLFGTSLASMPFLDYGGPCTEGSGIAEQLLAHAVRLLEEVKARYLEIRQCGLAPVDAKPRTDKVSMILDLTGGPDRLWKELPAKVRNQVRKAEKEKLRVTFGGGELLDEFYPVFVTNMRDLGSPVHDRGFFSEIFASFRDQSELAVVRDGSRVVGGLIALYFKDALVVPWASSLRESFFKCPNNLLYWEAIKRACEKGCTRFDFGRSSVGSGTYNFKRQWGAQPLQIYWETLVAGGSSYRCMFSPARYRLAVELWKRLPLSVTQILGPRLRKYITN